MLKLGLGHWYASQPRASRGAFFARSGSCSSGVRLLIFTDGLLGRSHGLLVRRAVSTRSPYQPIGMLMQKKVPAKNGRQAADRGFGDDPPGCWAEQAG